MKRIASCIILLLALVAAPIHAQWTTHFSYNYIVDALKNGNTYYVLYQSGNILSYDGMEVFCYDKSNLLNDKNIKFLDLSKKYQKLVIVYYNGNIDIFDTKKQTVVNIPQFMTEHGASVATTKLCVIDNIALVGTTEGFLWIDVEKGVLRAYVTLGSVSDIMYKDGYIYLQRNGDVVRCMTTHNVYDPSQWEAVSEFPNMPEGVSAHISRDEQLRLGEDIGKIGPESDLFYNMHWYGSHMLAAGGFMNYENIFNEICAMRYDGNRWSSFDTGFMRWEDRDTSLDGYYLNTTSVVQDPDYPNHHYMGTAHLGVLEYWDGNYQRMFFHSNSVLRSPLPEFPMFTRAGGLVFDENHNLWICNYAVDTVLVVRKRDDSWLKIYDKALDGCTLVENTMFDSKGRLWVCDARWAGTHKGGLFCRDFGGTLEDTRDDVSMFRNSFINEDGTPVEVTACYCVAEDHDGRIWIGTDAGLLVAESSDEWFNNDFLITQIKVPRNDGTNYADYLLATVRVHSIVVDGANRKWIGTTDDGLYLVSADGTETVHHFTTENSPLPSNNIYSISIRDDDGEVFIGTEGGLVSFHGGASMPEPTLDLANVKIYPNPLRPEHPNHITFQGLAADTELRIATIGGQVVHRGRSLGGKYEWDTCDTRGRPCGTGVYLLVATTPDGGTSLLGRFAIVR